MNIITKVLICLRYLKYTTTTTTTTTPTTTTTTTTTTNTTTTSCYCVLDLLCANDTNISGSFLRLKMDGSKSGF